MARLRPARRNVPSYVWLQNLAGDVQPRYLTGGFLGAAYSPLRVGTDLDNPSAPNFRVTAFDTTKDIAHDRLNVRWDLLNSLDTAPNGMKRFQERALDLVTGPEARQAFDLAVSALLEDLSVRGLLDSTLVVVVGEFGRSPRIVRAGRDHWPACYSALLAGAGIRRGLIHGASDAQGGYVRDNPVSPERFGA